MARGISPSTLVFDVNETLLDLTTLGPQFERLFGDPSVLRAWFAQLILYSEALTLSGLYTPFDEIAAGALRMIGEIKEVGIADADVKELKEQIKTMPAHDDAAPALARLQEADFRLVTLTNSPSAPSPTPLQRAGLAKFFERSFSVEEVRRFKPAPETYYLVAKELEVELSDLCLVACHLWDTIGAQAAGCSGALVLRPGNAAMPASGVPAPDIIASDLNHLADLLIRR